MGMGRTDSPRTRPGFKHTSGQWLSDKIREIRDAWEPVRQQSRVSSTPTIERRHQVIPLSGQAGHARLRLFFGGSFDPPHLGHATLPPLVLGRSGVRPARVVYVPATRSPHKPEPPIADQHRLAMLTLALRDVEHAEVWEQEVGDGGLNPGQPGYWADTWAIVRSMDLPGENRFLIGADQALSMHCWRRYLEFWDEAVVMLREGIDSPDGLIEHLGASGTWSPAQLGLWRSLIVPVPMIDASSTAIRAALADPTRRENPIAALDDRVHEYILKHGLYTVA